MQKFSEHKNHSEKAIEHHLVDEVTARGGLCLKFSSHTTTGYPDRLVLMPGGRCCWFELKSKGMKPTRLQRLRHDELRALGFRVYVIDDRTMINDALGDAGF